MARAKAKSKSKSVEVVEEKEPIEGEEEVDPEEEEEEEGDDEDGEEYEVETILEHRNMGAGKYEYLVSWKGYGPEHNTWEPQEHVEHASEVVSKYWASHPKTELGVKKRGRASAAVPPAQPKKSIKTDRRASANGRKAIAEAEEEEEPFTAFADSHVDPMTKYEDVGDWEDLVASVDSVERGSDNELVVYLTMTGGEKAGQASEVVNHRCPQKMLKFYESHLKWKSG